MRSSPPPLMPIFRSQHQASLLAWLLLHPQHEYTLTELARRLDVPLTTLQREAQRLASSTVGRVALKLDNMGIVVEDLTAAVDFFSALGLELEGRAMVEGEWAGRVTGLGDQRVEIAMMRTPDGHGRLELSRFLEPEIVADHRTAPVNALGYLRVMFAVDDLDETLARVREQGAELVSTEVVHYEDAYRLCYIRGPEGLLIGLAQALD
jgi:catechol 2,3-dioxygenase-like lactoylglutathione lyase family enzyme